MKKEQTMETVASILVNGVKQRFYPNNRVYLKNDTEFEIEFFNKSTRTVRASININGEQLRRNPVIHNGQRYVLRDFIDTPRRFLFHVYEVDSNNSDVKNAIRFNGLIEIKYYYEMKVEVHHPPDGTQFAKVADETQYPEGSLTETGKIMKGSFSDQKYTSVHLDWEKKCFGEQVIEILPISKKPKTLKCPNCELISKSDVNYCAKCGHSFFLDLPF